MNDLANGEQKLLDEMRQVLSPTRSDRDRLSARIAASIARGTPSPSHIDDADAGGASETAGVLAHGIRGIGRQVLAATLIAGAGVGAGYVMGRSRPNDSQVAAATQARPIDARPNVPVAPAGAAVPVAEEIPVLPRAPKAMTTASSRSVPPPSTQTLSEEARELQRVDRALRSGMPTLALGILRELDERIPHGVLLEERAAARLIARCQNGDADAPGAAGTWLERHGQSVYAPRLRAACTAK